MCLKHRIDGITYIDTQNLINLGGINHAETEKKEKSGVHVN